MFPEPEKGGRGEKGSVTERFTKLLEEFDPSKVVAEFSNALKQYKPSGVELDSLVASQKKNLEALTTANRVAFEGLQEIAKRQADILQEMMNEASKAVDHLSKVGSPPEIAAKRAELSKSAFERALANMRELAEIVSSARPPRKPPTPSTCEFPPVSTRSRNTRGRMNE